jgi:hypothetical protein
MLATRSLQDLFHFQLTLATGTVILHTTRPRRRHVVDVVHLISKLTVWYPASAFTACFFTPLVWWLCFD